MPLRYKVCSENAQAVAEVLLDNPHVSRVYYPGLRSHPGHEIAKRQQSYFGGMLSVELDLEKVSLEAFFRSLEIFKLCYSFGGIESIISHPWTRSHQCLPVEWRRDARVTEGLVRISCGIEDTKDLIKDLQKAILHAANRCSVC